MRVIEDDYPTPGKVLLSFIWTGKGRAYVGLGVRTARAIKKAKY